MGKKQKFSFKRGQTGPICIKRYFYAKHTFTRVKKCKFKFIGPNFWASRPLGPICEKHEVLRFKILFGQSWSHKCK